MKALVFSMLAMAAMVSCTSESDPINDGGNEKVEIKLNAGVIGVVTKAAIIPNGLDAFDNANGTSVALVKIDHLAADVANIYWTTATKETTNIKGTAVTLTGNQRYYDKEGKNAYFVGYYPDATITSGKVSYNGITGTTDILCTNRIDGGSKKSSTASNLAFNHMLSQIQIMVIGDVAAQNAFGKIKSVKLTNIPSDLELTIGETASIQPKTNSTKGDITLFEETTAEQFQSLTDIKATIGVVPMIVPGLGNSSENAISITVSTEKGGVSSPITISDITEGLVSGKKHIITLNFKEKITATASIASWGEDGAPGSGEVE